LSQVLLQTDLPGVTRVAQGKVRDIYDAEGGLLFVATDRISAFDHILASGIPDKGRVLTQISLFWFELLREVVPAHVITADFDEYPDALQPFRDQLEGRSMLVRKLEMLPVECVARGYLVGSGWKEYQQTGAVCGIGLPGGLRECDRLPEPIFTPATKAVSGHDENIPFERVVELVGKATATRLRDLTLELYTRAANYAASRGILIADTKFEFGRLDGQIVWGDEALTPDSSRFWPADQYEPGHAQPSFDKQYVREHLEAIGWNKQPPAPALPPEVVGNTSDKYREAFERLTGRTL
jgi:phosphoribosylaminoimidazole-succinocarboxamide synthase